MRTLTYLYKIYLLGIKHLVILLHVYFCFEYRKLGKATFLSIRPSKVLLTAIDRACSAATSSEIVTVLRFDFITADVTADGVLDNLLHCEISPFNADFQLVQGIIIKCLYHRRMVVQCNIFMIFLKYIVDACGSATIPP